MTFRLKSDFKPQAPQSGRNEKKKRRMAVEEGGTGELMLKREKNNLPRLFFKQASPP